MNEELEFELVPPHLAVQAMRDNGYKNTAYAVAELIDNAVQAGASAVELLALEVEEFVRQRTRRRLQKIAVLDNGSGMDETVLRLALQFGNGTHLDDREGIGRFGMGLPSASISQCAHVDVWSWTRGPDQALYSYVDLSQVAAGTMREVPEPRRDPLPIEWTDRARSLGSSGTLVVWSQLDRAMWRTGRALIRNSEFVIARMYRRFLAQGLVSIRMASFVEGTKVPTIDDFATANDPGYLLVPSSTPSPYDNDAMFQVDGDSWDIPYRIRFRDQEHEVHLRFSYAKENARSVPNAGATAYGKHAGNNVGVSLVRAERELDMDQSLVNTYDPRERWWGVEVDFPPSLDELFGVTNNKQTARHFSEIANRFEALKSQNSDFQRFKDELEEDDDPSGPLIDIVDLIDRRLRVLRKVIEVQRKGTSAARRRYDSGSAEAAATAATRERQKQGLSGASDSDESLPEQEREQQLAKELVESGMTASDADEMAARTISSGIKYTFHEAELEGRSFFTVRPVAGEIVIKVNVSHPAYKNLLEVLEEDVAEDTPPDQLRARLQRAGKGLKLLLMAWARYEDEQPSESLRTATQDVRAAWGAMAYRFLLDE